MGSCCATSSFAVKQALSDVGESSISHDCFLSHRLWESPVSAFTRLRTLSLNTELIKCFLLQKGFSQMHGTPQLMLTLVSIPAGPAALLSPDWAPL